LYLIHFISFTFSLAAINALAHRFFYALFRHPALSAEMKKKFDKKLDKIKKPQFLQSIRLRSVKFGPNVPCIKSAQLVSLDKQGKLVYFQSLKLCFIFSTTIGI